MATTYAELKTEIADFIDRTDLTTQIDKFIDMAEADLRRELRVGENECLTTVLLSKDDEKIAVPDDWAGARKVTYINTDGDREECHFFALQKLETVQEALENYATGPRRYTIYDNAIWLVPAASADNDQLELVYYFEVAGLSATNTTNWILTNEPYLYLHLCLFHAYLYLQNHQMAVAYQALALNTIERMRDADQQERWGYPLATEVVA